MINTKEPKDTNSTLDSMVQEARGYMSDEELMVFIEKLEKFNDLCQSHDWNYAFTDDASVWRRGDKERQEITRMARELSQLGYNLEADEILKTHMY